MLKVSQLSSVSFTLSTRVSLVQRRRTVKNTIYTRLFVLDRFKLKLKLTSARVNEIVAK